MKLIQKGFPSQQAIKFTKDVEITMEYLYSRWQDEKKYEDIKDYKIPVDEIAKKHGVTVIKMTKKPFGFTFTVSDTVEPRTYEYGMSSTKLYWKRIA